MLRNAVPVSLFCACAHVTVMLLILNSCSLMKCLSMIEVLIVVLHKEGFGGKTLRMQLGHCGYTYGSFSS